MKNKAKFPKFMKNWKFWEKSLMIRQKAHTEGKSLPKPDNIDSWWSLGKSKKSVEQKGKTQAKRFPYDLRCPKPRDQKIEKFLPQLISSGVCRTSGEKKSWKRFLTPRHKRSGWGLCLNLVCWGRRSLLSKSALIRPFRAKENSTHKWKICHLRKSGFSLA